ncbi:transthyretin-like family domain-containing protein [Ditylenchus destructor]|nr:transthyretin-like family domain-containing protein [Ditylenchus destructor]
MVCSRSSDVQDRRTWVSSANITAYGQLFCNKVPQSGRAVYLMEFNKVGGDTRKQTRLTDENGYFSVYGTTTETTIFSGIDYYIQIIHYCNSEPNQRRETLYLIPKESHNGIYDMSFIDLDKRPDDNCKVKISECQYDECIFCEEY